MNIWPSLQISTHFEGKMYKALGISRLENSQNSLTRDWGFVLTYVIVLAYPPFFLWSRILFDVSWAVASTDRNISRTLKQIITVLFHTIHFPVLWITQPHTFNELLPSPCYFRHMRVSLKSPWHPILLDSMAPSYTLSNSSLLVAKGNRLTNTDGEDK